MSSTGSVRSMSGDAVAQSTRLSSKNKKNWSGRHRKLGQKIGFDIAKNGAIQSCNRQTFPTHSDALEYVKTSNHWLCERARIEAIRRAMLWS